MMLMCLWYMLVMCASICHYNLGGLTYKWQTAVGAEANLWFVDIDEDSRVTQWPSSAIARDLALVCPTYRLLMDEFDRSKRSRLEVCTPLSAIEQTLYPRNSHCNALEIGVSYLISNNHLLKSWPNHRLFP